MAKNLFGYNVKSGEPRMPLDGEEFVLRRLEGELSSKYNSLKEEARAIEKSSSFPLWVTVVKAVLLLAGVILLCGAIRALSDTDVPLATKAANGLWWILGAGVACFLAGIALTVAERVKKKRAEGSPAAGEFGERARLLAEDSSAMLRVPEDATCADVFTFPYKVRFNREVSAIATSQYFNVETRAFREGDMLCLADSEQVVGIPLAKIEFVACVRRRVLFMGWNKQIPFNKGKMKEYKIRANDYGALSVKPYYALFIRGSEEFVLLFPAYEWETFSSLLGSKAQELREVKKIS